MHKYFSDTNLKVFPCKLQFYFHLKGIIDTVNYLQVRMREVISTQENLPSKT